MTTVAADVTARGLTLWSVGPLDFGPGIRALVAGQLVAIAAAVVAIAVVLGVDTRQEVAAWGRAPDGEAG